MRRIAVVGALVGVVAVLSGCWAFGPLTGRAVEPSSPLRPTFAPDPSTGSSLLVDGGILIVQLHGADGAPVTADEVLATIGVVQARLGPLGADATVKGINDDRLRIEIADASQADAVTRVATAPGRLEFVPVPNAFANAVVEGEPLPADMAVRPLFDGDSITTLTLGESVTGQPAIDVRLDAEAAAAFDAWAAEHLGESFAMVLDERVISAPTINTSEFNGHAQISGDFDLQGITELIAILQGGVLPVEAEVLTVCPAAGDCPGPLASPSDGPPG